MLTILVLIVIALIIAIPIGLIALHVNGDDGKPWQHQGDTDEHRWE